MTGERSPRGPLRMVLLSVFCSLVFMAGAVFVTTRGCSDARGSLVVAGQGPGGTFTFSATQCRSGEREGTSGVLLLGQDPETAVVVLLDDPTAGASLTIRVPTECESAEPSGCFELVIRPEQCAIFRLSVRDTDTRINNITLRTGYLEVDCSLPDGISVKGKSSFEGCG